MARLKQFYGRNHYTCASACKTVWQLQAVQRDPLKFSNEEQPVLLVCSHSLDVLHTSQTGKF